MELVKKKWPTHIVAGAGYVIDGKGNILIVKTHHRGWDCTGGQIEVGENLEEGVIREILEESGVKAKVKTLVGIYSNVGQHLYYDGVTNVPTKVMMDFICEYESGELRTSDETTEVKWVPLTEVMDYITAAPQRYRFEKVVNFAGTVTYGTYISKPDFKLLSEREI